jgi:glutamate mutase epsilon subunit
MYKSKDIQGTTPFVAPKGKRTSEQIAQADADQKTYMQVKHGTRELGEFIENLDGDPTESTKAGMSAPLPRVTK